MLSLQIQVGCFHSDECSPSYQNASIERDGLPLNAVAPDLTL